MPRDFNIKGALAGGYSPEEIAEYIRKINLQPRSALAAPVLKMSPTDAEAAFQAAKATPRPQFVDPFQAGAEQVAGGLRKLWEPSGTTANDPRFWEQKATGASDVIRGTTPFAVMAGLPALAAAPLPTLAGLMGGMGAQHGTEYLAGKAGLPPGQTALLGDLAGLVGGSLVGGMAHGITPAVQGSVSRVGDIFSHPEEFGSAALERMRQRGTFNGTKLNAGIDPADFGDMAIWGASKIVRGVNDFASWAREMTQRFGAIDSDSLQRLWTDSRMLFADRQAGSEVSTRVPTAVNAPEDALATMLTTGYDSWQSQPKQFAKNAETLKEYPNFRDIRSTVPTRIAAGVLDRVVNNLLTLHDAMPAVIRDRSRLWYDGANKLAHDFSGEYGVTPEQSAGTLAVLSPQKDWFMNVDLAKRILNGWSNREALNWSPEMGSTWDNKIGLSIADEGLRRSTFDAIQGRRFTDIDPDHRPIWFRLHDEANYPRNYPAVTPEGGFGDLVRTKSGDPGNVAWGDYGSIRKALSILEDGSRENISRMLGNEHKVRSFYNNIINPNSRRGHVTIDTHAVAAALLRALSGSSDEVLHNFGGKGSASSSVTGESGMYGLYAEAYRRAAAQRGLLPREMQSITWEAIRGLFSPEFKRSPQLTKAVNDLWRDVSRGKIDRSEAIDRVWRIANGIQEPGWVGTGLGSGPAPAAWR